jgi:hypothetical protein
VLKQRLTEKDVLLNGSQNASKFDKLFGELNSKVEVKLTRYAMQAERGR